MGRMTDTQYVWAQDYLLSQTSDVARHVEAGHLRPDFTLVDLLTFFVRRLTPRGRDKARELGLLDGPVHTEAAAAREYFNRTGKPDLPACFEPTKKQTKKPKATCEDYGIPKPTAWRDVTLEFIDGHTLSVRVNGKTVRVSFIDMGFATRHRNPTVQWDTLRKLADADDGILTACANDNEAVKKRIGRLSEGLQLFFGMPSKPVIREGHDWKIIVPVA